MSAPIPDTVTIDRGPLDVIWDSDHDRGARKRPLNDRLASLPMQFAAMARQEIIRKKDEGEESYRWVNITGSAPCLRAIKSQRVFDQDGKLKYRDFNNAKEYLQVSETIKEKFSPPPDFSRVHLPDRGRVTINLYNGMAEIKTEWKPPKVKKRKKRGRILGFSRKSRSRCLKKLMKSEEAPGAWGTLTISDECIPDIEIKSLIEWITKKQRVLGQYIKRNCPGYGVVWKKEWKKRKSGKFLGFFVCHLHLTITGPESATDQDLLRVWWIIRDEWIRLLGTTSEAAFAVLNGEKSFEILRSKKRAAIYVSTYVSKRDDVPPGVDSIGRNWGTWGEWKEAEPETFQLAASEYSVVRRILCRYMKSTSTQRKGAKNRRGLEYWKKLKRMQGGHYVLIPDIEMMKIMTLALRETEERNLGG